MMERNIEKLAKIGEVALRKRVVPKILGVERSFEMLSTFLDFRDEDKMGRATIWQRDAVDASQEMKRFLREYGLVRKQFVECGINPKEYDDKIREMKIYESLNMLRNYSSEAIVAR